MRFDKETQQRVLRVAAQHIEGEEVDEFDERIAFVMKMHPEFDAIWELGEMAIYPQEIDGKIVNPFVHTVLHVIVDKQIIDENPEFVAATHKRLKENGADEHEALHAIIGVYADRYFSTFRKGDGFSMLDYEAELETLEVGTGEAEEPGE